MINIVKHTKELIVQILEISIIMDILNNKSILIFKMMTKNFHLKKDFSQWIPKI